MKKIITKNIIQPQIQPYRENYNNRKYNERK